jgi:hypothetical protein
MNQLLDVQRHTIAASREREPVVLRQARLERIDQLEPAGLCQRLQLDRLPRAGLWRARSGHDQHVSRATLHQLGQKLACRLVEPVHVLRNHDCGPSASARDDVAQGCPRHLLFEHPALGRGQLVSRARIYAQDRSEEGDRLRHVLLQSREFLAQALEALWWACVVTDAAAGLDEAPDGVEARVHVERRAVQLEEAGAAQADLVIERRYQA